MKNKLSLKTRLCMLSAVLVAATMIVAVLITESGLFELRTIGKESLIEQSRSSALAYSAGKSLAIDARMNSVFSKIEMAARNLEDMYANPQNYVQREVPAIGEFKGKDVEGINVFSYITAREDQLNDPKIKEELELIAPLESIFESIKSNSDRYATLAVYTTTGISIGYDADTATKVDIKEFDPEGLNKDYYIVPKATGEMYITDVYEDSFGRGKMLTVSYPYFVEGEFRGVVCADIMIEDINMEMVDSEEYTVEGEIKLILDRDGGVICYTQMDNADNQQLVHTLLDNIDVSAVLNNESGDLLAAVNAKNYLVVFDDAPVCEWKFLDILPYASITEPSVEYDGSIRTTNVRMCVAFVILQIVLSILALGICKKMLRPLLSLTESVSKINDDNIEFTSGITSGDEIELLGNKFEMAIRKVKEYMEHLAAAEAERQRIGAELNVATEIQASYLPSLFPPFPDRHEFDIYATMCPAKEVGGDFYDFFFIDHDHLALVIADVSGKGVGAAMFMMISKTFINGQAHMNMSPAAILSEVNDRLCENNSAEMFVTVWLGILDVKTGKIVASNGGHEYPFICRAGGQYELLKDKHGMALGAYPEMKYSEYEITLNKGDVIFVYTDGVAEATDANNELFGTDRALETLNKNPEADMHDTVVNEKAGIDEFVKEAPQFDDITMMALRYFGDEG